ncbi:hypothetical protein D9M68_663720 [compost metagenome]
MDIQHKSTPASGCGEVRGSYFPGVCRLDGFTGANPRLLRDATFDRNWANRPAVPARIAAGGSYALGVSGKASRRSAGYSPSRSQALTAERESWRQRLMEVE